MKLSEITGEQSIRVMGRIMGALRPIAADEESKNVMASGDRLAMIEILCEKHPASLVKVLAALENQPVDEYEKNLNMLTLPAKLMEMMQDEDLMQLFS